MLKLNIQNQSEDYIKYVWRMLYSYDGTAWINSLSTNIKFFTDRKKNINLVMKNRNKKISHNHNIYTLTHTSARKTLGLEPRLLASLRTNWLPKLFYSW